MSIPEITDERLKLLAKKIRPVIRHERRKGLFYIKPCDLREESFSWDPKIESEARGIISFDEIRTLHTYSYYGMFKPSVAEVLAQIPPHLAETAVAFEVKGPKDADDLNKETVALNAGFHVARTILYKLKNAPRPDDQR